MSNDNIPFPPGTIRGPYVCGMGDNPQGGIQYLVKELSGGWRPFIRSYKEQEQCKQAANLFALDMFKGLPQESI